jgi:hypothetical protein
MVFKWTCREHIAIVTGKISRIIAFDIDGEEANHYFNRIIESLDDEELRTALRHSLCIKTGSGNTNIILGFREEEFASTDDKIPNFVLWRSEKEDVEHDEIRVKGEGGYIVAPPSIHPNANRYEITSGSIPTIPALSKAHINRLISTIQIQTQSPVVYQGTPIDAANAHLNEKDVSDIVAILKPYYQHGNRNDFTMYLSGLMRKEGVSFGSALKVIEAIVAEDEEKSARIRTLRETYKKHDLDKVCGYSGLVLILVNQTQNQDRAKQILEQVKSIFPKTHDSRQSAEEKEQKSPSQSLIELAHANTSLFFKDQHGTAFVLIAQTEGHKELIPLESDRFKRYLAKLFYDNNNKAIAKTENINNAIHILHANVEYNGQTV